MKESFYTALKLHPGWPIPNVGGSEPGTIRTFLGNVASVTKVGAAAADNSYEPCDR
jgi:hypothetical protein